MKKLIDYIEIKRIQKELEKFKNYCIVMGCKIEEKKESKKYVLDISYDKFSFNIVINGLEIECYLSSMNIKSHVYKTVSVYLIRLLIKEFLTFDNKVIDSWEPLKDYIGVNIDALNLMNVYALKNNFTKPYLAVKTIDPYGFDIGWLSSYEDYFLMVNNGVDKKDYIFVYKNHYSKYSKKQVNDIERVNSFSIKSFIKYCLN